MNNHYVPSQKDIEKKINEIGIFLVYLSIFALGFIIIWIMLDGFINYYGLYPPYFFLPILILFLLGTLTSFFLEKISLILSKVIKNNDSKIYIFLCKSEVVINFFEKLTKFLLKPIIFPPLMMIVCFIMHNGFLLVSDWVIYADHVALPNAIYWRVDPFRDEFCVIPRWRKASEKSTTDICDVKYITYQGKNYIRKMQYDISYTNQTDAPVPGAVYASRIFPSHMTMGIVLNKDNLIFRTIDMGIGLVVSFLASLVIAFRVKKW